MMLHQIEISSLEPGITPDHPIRDEHDRVVVGAGVAVSDEVLQRLWDRGVRRLLIHRDDLPQLRSFRSTGSERHVPENRANLRPSIHTLEARKLDQAIDRGGPLRCKLQPGYRAIQVDPQSTTPYDPQHRRELVHVQQRSMKLLDTVFSQFGQGRAGAVSSVHDVAQQTVSQITPDIDLFVCLGINPQSTGYPVRHSWHTAMLAAAIGANLGLDEGQLVELSAGCLVHDLGMLRVPEELYTSPRVLDDESFQIVAGHPVHALELLKATGRNIPDAVRLIAYQMHERLDGSGYPRGRMGDDIHDLARIAALADVYVALVSQRPHRSGLLPYYAVEKLLHDTAAGLFDSSAMRGLLMSVSLFPLGSCVQMNDGRVGRVLRSRGMQFDRPIVELWRPDRLFGEPSIVDLCQSRHLKVQRVIPELRAA